MCKTVSVFLIQLNEVVQHVQIVKVYCSTYCRKYCQTGFGQFLVIKQESNVGGGGRGRPVGMGLICVFLSQPDPARPHSYLFHKLRSKCRRWQIRPGSGTASLQQLLSRNSPSMPCWGWGTKLKDSWAGCVIKSLHDRCATWLIMSHLKRRQEKGKYCSFLVRFLTLPTKYCKGVFLLSSCHLQLMPLLYC